MEDKGDKEEEKTLKLGGPAAERGGFVKVCAVRAVQWAGGQGGTW